MLGAVIGDIAGSRFEWKNRKCKDFTMFAPSCSITDDSVMTLAVAQALLDSEEGRERLAPAAVRRMQSFGRRWARGCYGGSFARWLLSEDPRPYGSYGNGAAMRVSACAWAASSLDDALDMARRVTAVTHDHPEGLKGAAAVTSVQCIKRGIHRISQLYGIFQQLSALCFFGFLAEYPCFFQGINYNLNIYALNT